MYIGDLHIHSHYSRATSKDLTPEYLDLWARKKGIDIVGTGDFTHPAWRAELAEKLEPAEPGLYILKKERMIRHSCAAGSPQPRFVISGEISSIYKKNDKVRKVHSLILLPSLEDAEILSRRLEAIGNIHSDAVSYTLLDVYKRQPHDCRHTFSKLCEHFEVKENDRKRMLGHSFKDDITNKIYGHRDLEDLRREIEKIQVNL